MVGRVGFPFSMVLASIGMSVEIIDTDEKKLNLIKKGESPYIEYGIEQILNKIKKFDLSYSTNFENVNQSDIVILTIGTPIDEYLNPDYKSFFATLETLLNFLKKDQLLILRSTLFPGTSKKIDQIIKKKKIKFKISLLP